MTGWTYSNPDARLTDPQRGTHPFETSLARAQRHANFVVFEPNWMPADCELSTATLRPEQPPGAAFDGDSDSSESAFSGWNPASVRVEIRGDDRRLRLKQFLYDWAPPSASIAPLWGSDCLEPFDCQYTVGWLGEDYKGNRGASVQLARTQVELSVLDGAFSTGELTDILSGVTPANPSVANRIRRVPFHRLSYWLRYRCQPPSLPHGVYEYTERHPYADAVPTAPVAFRDDEFPLPLIPPSEAYILDSGVTFPSHSAIECLYRDPDNCSDHLWMVAANEASAMAPQLPPSRSDCRAETRTQTTVRETTVSVGALDDEYGAWEAFWQEGDTRYAVWASSSSAVTTDSFLETIASLHEPTGT